MEPGGPGTRLISIPYFLPNTWLKAKQASLSRQHNRPPSLVQWVSVQGVHYISRRKHRLLCLSSVLLTGLYRTRTNIKYDMPASSLGYSTAQAVVNQPRDTTTSMPPWL